MGRGPTPSPRHGCGSCGRRKLLTSALSCLCSRLGEEEEEGEPGELGAAQYFLGAGARWPPPAPGPAPRQLRQRVSAPHHPVTGHDLERDLGLRAERGVESPAKQAAAAAAPAAGRRRRPWNNDKALAEARPRGVGGRQRRSI